MLIPFGTDAQREIVRKDSGLDQPFFTRYAEWLGGLVHGDLGNYYTVSSKRPVADRVKDALPISLSLMVYAQVLALLIAIPLGVLTAYRQETFFDRCQQHGRVRHARHTHVRARVHPPVLLRGEARVVPCHRLGSPHPNR